MVAWKAVLKDLHWVAWLERQKADSWAAQWVTSVDSRVGPKAVQLGAQKVALLEAELVAYSVGRTGR